MRCRRLATELRVAVLGVDRLLQSRQFPAQVARPLEAVAEQSRLEPAVEVLHAAVELRLPCRNEDGADPEAQAEPDHPREGACRRPPAGQLAGVVELDLLRPAQVLPALAEEPENLVHAARAGQAQADSAVEGVLAHPEVVAVTAALEVDWPDEIHLVEFVGGPTLWARGVLTWQQGGQAGPRARPATACQGRLECWCA